MLNLLSIAGVAYLMGSIPTSVWVGKLAYGIDIREHGSGNAGATNVYRTLGWKPALFVTLVDIGKGLIPTLFVSQWRITPLETDPVNLQLLAGIAAVAGHVWTIFAGFRGGKGVATAAGMLIVLYPLAIPFCLAVFLLVVGLTRYVSLASMTAVAALPVFLLIGARLFSKEAPAQLLALSLAIVVFILFTHRGNIQRLLGGTENKIGLARKNSRNSG